MASITWNNVKAFFGCRPVADALLRDTGELTIEIPALPRPTLEEIQKKCPWVTSIERDTSPEGPVTLKLATVLRTGEKRIDGKEYKRRRASMKDVALGYQHWQWLLDHQNEYPAFMALLGMVYIDFPGIVVVCGGGLFIPYCGIGGCGAAYLSKGIARWIDYWDWSDSNIDPRVRIAVVSKQ